MSEISTNLTRKEWHLDWKLCFHGTWIIDFILTWQLCWI